MPTPLRARQALGSALAADAARRGTRRRSADTCVAEKPEGVARRLSFTEQAKERLLVRTLNPVKRHREHCRAVRVQMSEYLDGELDPRAAAKVRRHALMCPNCRRMLENLHRSVAGLQALHGLPVAVDELRRG